MVANPALIFVRSVVLIDELIPITGVRRQVKFYRIATFNRSLIRKHIEFSLTRFWRGRIFKFRDALSPKAHRGFLFLATKIVC